MYTEYDNIGRPEINFGGNFEFSYTEGLPQSLPGPMFQNFLWSQFVNVKIDCLSLAKPFQPSLMFASKAVAYPREAHFRCSSLG